jgi:hypothetical protein
VVCNAKSESGRGIIPQSESFYIHSIVYSAGRCLDRFKEYEESKDKSADAEYLMPGISFPAAFSIVTHLQTILKAQGGLCPDTKQPEDLRYLHAELERPDPHR